MKFLRSLGLLLLLLLPLAASATHIVGGELDLQYKSGSTYTLSLNLYFDAINGDPQALDQSLVAGIFEKATNQRVVNVTLPLTSNTFVQYTNPACAVGSLNTRKLVYTKEITLDAATYANAGGYYVAVERCCRNISISNIINPGGAAQTFYLEFPAVVRSGAAFITWSQGLSAANQIPGLPSLGIDARSGRLTVRASSLGLFVFGVRCAEYRKGVKIGETRRDFQLYVLNCPTNVAPRLQVHAANSATLYRPGRDTLRLLPGGNRCLTIRYTDPDPNSVLTMSTRAVNFTVPAPTFTTSTSGTVRAAGAPDTLTATLCFPDCADTKGKVYLLDLIVADNGCSLPKHDTLRVAFTATQAPNAAPVLTSSFPPAPAPTVDAAPTVVRVTLGQRYAATLTGTDVDRNALALAAVGEGFDLAGMGMQFAAQNGAGLANGTFAWEPTCAAVAAIGTNNGLVVHFKLTETGPCVPLPQERAIRFEVVPVAELAAFRPANVITPNGDGLNDFLRMPDLPVDFCDNKFAGIKIFSRWGQEVFTSAERGFQWGGQGAGGLYYYLATYTDGRKFKGWVEVIP